MGNVISQFRDGKLNDESLYMSAAVLHHMKKSMSEAQFSALLNANYIQTTPEGLDIIRPYTANTRVMERKLSYRGLELIHSDREPTHINKICDWRWDDSGLYVKYVKDKEWVSVDDSTVTQVKEVKHIYFTRV